MVKGTLTGLGGMGGGIASDSAYNQASIHIKGAGGSPVKLPTGLMGPPTEAPGTAATEQPVDGVPGLGPWPKVIPAQITAAQMQQLAKWLTAMSWDQWRQTLVQYGYQVYDKYGKITNPKADMVWIQDFADQSLQKFPVKGGVGDSKPVLVEHDDGDQKLYYAIVEKMMGGASGADTGTTDPSVGKGSPGGTKASLGPLGMPWLWWGIGGGLGIYFLFGGDKKKKKAKGE
tara:strand:- start:1407 stop:2096 length:690 start_codon:yes stop_codon:yes gene_type:complete